MSTIAGFALRSIGRPCIPRVALVVLAVCVSACESRSEWGPPPPNERLDLPATARWVSEHALKFDPAAPSDSAMGAIAQEMADSRMVMLGEADPSTREQVGIKLSLVRALHEQGGFNVLAFEGPVWECTPVLNPTARYDKVLFDGCVNSTTRGSEELRLLFDYVASTQRTPRPLVLVGVGMQRAASHAATLRPAAWAALVAPTDKALARRTFVLDSSFYEREQGPDPLPAPSIRALGSDMPEPAALGKQPQFDFDSLARWFRHAAAGQLDEAGEGAELRRARLLLASMAAATSANVAESFRSHPRTSTGYSYPMAHNLAFVADTLYPSQKIVVWSRNHAARRGSRASRMRGFYHSVSSIVSHDHPEYGVFAVGLFASMKLGAQIEDAKARIEGFAKARIYDIRAVLAADSGRAMYLGTRPSRTDSSAGFLHARLRTFDYSGSDDVQLNEDYDAVIAVAGATEPKLLPPPAKPKCCPRLVERR